MIRQFTAAVILILWAGIAPVSAAAQDTILPNGAIMNTENWERLAQRAEDLAGREDASVFGISRLRAELVVWRDAFLELSTINEGRLATVDAQLAALGPEPESGTEPPAVAARRAALTAQRANLVAPRLLAQEAHARASGIITEFDRQVLQRQTAELGVRSPSPLNPAHMAGALAAFGSLIEVVSVETRAAFSLQMSSGRLGQNLPRGLIFLILGIGLLGVGRRSVTRWRGALTRREGRWQALSLFLLSLVQIIVPLLGLWALTEGLDALDIFGLRGGDMVNAIPLAGSFVIFGWWLSQQIFPTGPLGGYLGYDAQTRASGRRYGSAMAWVLAFGTIFDAGLQTLEVTDGAAAAMEFVALVLIGLLFWRLGRVVKTPPETRPDMVVSQGRMRSLVGRFCTVVAIVAPLLAAFGFVAAGRALIVPSIMSLALIGVILLLQRIVHDLSRAPEDGEGGRGLYALMPVIISFVLYMISMPFFALIWGARVDDLLEVWTRFREGFAIGDSRISPTDFLMFAAVFSLGYLLTRFIQATLRKTVLPRTRLDLGGQNAIVAGFGYVGIILAAIIAITSAGIDLSNLAIVAGALSVGIGFGLQNIVSNFVSGIILLIERPVSEGDWIEVGGQMGYVRAISVRSTRIETFDRTDVIIPNADLVSGQVTNWTRGNLVGRVIVPVGVAYGSDVDKVTTILRGIAEAHPLVILTPPPAVLFQGFGADSLDFEIRAILRDVNYVLQTKSEMNYEITKQFAEAGIEIPFAQRDIWLRNPEVLKGAIQND